MEEELSSSRPPSEEEDEVPRRAAAEASTRRGKAHVSSPEQLEIVSSGAAKRSRSSDNLGTSDYIPPQRWSRRLRNSLQTHSSHHEKLNTSVFQSYLECLWNRIPEEKRSSFTCLDCLWFHLYKEKSRKTKVLEWIKKRKGIFSWRYVFVPIVCWSHWSLLILCNFGETRLSKTRTTCMLLLDSLQEADPTRLKPDIRRFVFDIYKSEGRKEANDFISKIPLLIPKVPQQKSGEECGMFVLYFIYRFVQHAPDYFNQEEYPYFLTEDWFSLEEFESFGREIHSILTN